MVVTSLRAPLRGHAAQFTAGPFSYYNPGMTDESKERSGLTEAARPLPIWMLLVLAAVAIVAYAFFIMDF
jgi:hypothetical protein